MPHLVRSASHRPCNSRQPPMLCGKSRKNLFFKPSGGHGGKAVYRGDKLTKGVWAKISQGGYVAQTLVRPSERMIRVDDAAQARKWMSGFTLMTGGSFWRLPASIKARLQTSRRLAAGLPQCSSI